MDTSGLGEILGEYLNDYLVQHAVTDYVGRTCQCDASKVSRDLLQTFIFILGLSWLPGASEFVSKAFCQSEDR